MFSSVYTKAELYVAGISARGVLATNLTKRGIKAFTIT